MNEEQSKINQIVALELYTLIKKKKEQVWFSKLVENLKGKADKKQISRAIDFMTDICMIDAEYQQVDGGKWARCFSIDEVYEAFLEELYKQNVEVKA